MMQAEFEKFAQDVYTAAFEECLLVSRDGAGGGGGGGCIRGAACLTRRSWTACSLAARSSEVMDVALVLFLFVLLV